MVSKEKQNDLLTFVRSDNPIEASWYQINPWITSCFLVAPANSFILSKVQDIIINPSEMYRFNEIYFWWHKIISEIANKDEYILNYIRSNFSSSDPSHCIRKFSVSCLTEATVIKRSYVKKLIPVIEQSKFCCDNTIGTTSQYNHEFTRNDKNKRRIRKEPDLLNICHNWNCKVLGANL